MKNKFYLLTIVAFSLILLGCNIDMSPDIGVIYFSSNNIITYTSSVDSNGQHLCSVKSLTVTPDQGVKYRINLIGYRREFFLAGYAKCDLYLNKDIPEGALVRLDFEDDNGDFYCTSYIVNSTERKLAYIKFVDDKTVKYQFSWTSDGAPEKRPACYVKTFSITPEYDCSIKSNLRDREDNEYVTEIVFDKPIPDGSTITIDFVDIHENPVCTHSFVKSR